MNKIRPLISLLSGVAGTFAVVALPTSTLAQTSPRTEVRPTVRPAIELAAASPIPTERATTPAPDTEPEEKSPPTDKPESEVTTETDIEGNQSASFNSKERIAVFIGSVKVTDPRFQLVCDRLTVFLNKAAPAGQNPPAAPTPAPAVSGKAGKGKSATPEQTTGGGGIDHAIAEGHVVILQKKAPAKPGDEETISIGRGETGTFDNKTGDMILKGWPSLEQNGSSLIATSAGTVMTIHRDGGLYTLGPYKTKLIQRGKGGGLDIPIGPAVQTGGGKRGKGNPPSGGR